MVYFHSSISVCNSVDQPATTTMANSVNSIVLHPKQRHINNHTHKNKKLLNNNSPNPSIFPVCDQSPSAAMDILILIAVVTAFGFLVFPYVKFVSISLFEFIGLIVCIIGGEVARNPLLFGSISLSISFAALVTWVVLTCTSSKCGNRNCKGLKKSAEFDIQLENEDCVKNSSPKGGLKRGLFELPRDHYRELEAELKKIAPPNGRAVLVFRAKCGCSVGRLEVPGPKKQRKIKK